MKYLILVVFLISCGGENSKKVFTVDKPGYNFINTPMDLVFNGAPSFGGTVDNTGDGGYFITHNNPDCAGVLKGICRKTNIKYTEGLPVVGRVTHYSFSINILKYNMDDSPEWVIVWQAWSKLFDGDGGNHPPQTIKLINDSGQLKLCGFDNAWQFDLTELSELGHSPDGSTHPHPDDRNNGCVDIEIGSESSIDLYIWDYGRTAFYANDNLILDKEYQVNRIGKGVVMLWGAYWSLGYNKELDPSKSIELTINGLERAVN